jgi:hypothetical protein
MMKLFKNLNTKKKITNKKYIKYKIKSIGENL